MKQILAGSLVVVTIILLVTGAYLRFSALEKKGEALTKTQLRYSSSSHLSGIINVPTGTGIDQTKISLKKGERIWLKSISKTPAVVWDDNRKREIKIPYRGTRRPCTKTGKLQFVKQAYPTRIDYEISPG